MVMAAYREPDLCGVMITEVYLMGTGGYSHLHRDVWLLEAKPETFETAPFSHIIIRREKLGDVPAEIRTQDGDWVLARVLDRPCSPRPPSGV